MGILPASSFQDYFATLTDPRCPDAPNSRHQLMDMLIIAVCAVICGADGWEDIEEYGTSQAEWFATFLDLPHGIPSHDTFRRVLSRLDPEELTQCFIAWTEALREASGGDIVSIDGKTLRHSFDQASGQAAIHMGSAWASANRLVLGQLKVEEKSNEITAIPKLIQMLDIAGATVTIDAMGCQKEIAKVITDREADYVLALKENHPTLSGDVTRFFDEAKATAFADIAHAYHETVDGDHGRIETRRYWITSDIEWLGAKASWAKLHSIGMVESCREVGETVQVETRYFLTSLPAQGVRFAQAVRQHWGIENSLHWVLDVSFNEDACRIRKDKGAQIFSMLRHIAINLLRQERRHKRGMKARRKRAGWDRDYLLHVLAG
ncbi:MAG TPA: ISAs1 family transposase [Candidatus Saccharimonadia bacterium]|nr:ISAs1 family transposase [Candidatus Saccharimonadia bacterium]